MTRNLPLSDTRAEMIGKALWTRRITSCPDFRGKSEDIADSRRQGLESDMADCLYDLMEVYDAEKVESYWREHIAGRDIVWVVVGDRSKFDMTALDKFGPVLELKADDVLR